MNVHGRHLFRCFIIVQKRKLQDTVTQSTLYVTNAYIIIGAFCFRLFKIVFFNIRKKSPCTYRYRSIMCCVWVPPNRFSLPSVIMTFIDWRCFLTFDLESNTTTSMQYDQSSPVDVRCRCLSIVELYKQTHTHTFTRTHIFIFFTIHRNHLRTR